MKPGSIKPDLKGPGQVLPNEQVGRVDNQQTQKTDLHQQIPDGKSQLPEAPSSTVARRGESQVVKARQQQAKRTGKRQKFLKVPTVKTLSKQARMAFKSLSELLGKAAELLMRFKRKMLDDDAEDQQQKRRQQEEEPEEQDRKIDPSKVPRGLEPQAT